MSQDSGVDPRLLLPKHLCALCIGISVQAFSNWGLKPHSRKGREALFLLPEVFAEFERRRAPQLSGDFLDLEQERARLAKEQADKTAMENAQRRAEVADLGAVGKVWGQLLATYRARMLGAPSKLAPQVNPENPNLARDLIAAEHERILEELANTDLGTESGELPTNPEGADVDHPAAAAVDGEPVGGSVPTAKRRKQRGARTVEH